MNPINTLEQVKIELTELRKLGIKVPDRAFTILSEAEAREYRMQAMRVSEIADLAIQLAS